MSEIQTPFPEITTQRWGGDSIKIVERYNADKGQPEELVDVLGVRVKRRNPSLSNLPGTNLSPEEFTDLSFTTAEISYLQTALMRHKMGHHVLFLGPPGLGKSRMTEFIAYLLNVPFYRVGCQRGMNVTKEILWTMVPKENGGWEGRLGPLPISMKEGAILLVDELANLEPAERQALLQPTEKPNNRKISPSTPTLNLPGFPGNEVKIKAAEGWLIIATGNYAEGQGAGEIHPFSDREVRRVRPHMLGSLPAGVRRRRAVGRWFPGELPQPTINLPRVNYYDEDENPIMNAETAEAVTELFEEFDRQLEGILKTVRQDPPVYMTEALERAFDQTMLFHIKHSKKAPDGTDKSTLIRRKEEVMATAKAAIEFCFISGFRDETLVRVPDIEQDGFKGGGGKMEDNGRAKVKDYLRWKMNRLFATATYEVLQPGGAKLTVNFEERLKAALKKAVDTSDSTEVIMKLVDQQIHAAQAITSKMVPPGTPLPSAEKLKTALAKMTAAELQCYQEMKRPILIIEADVEASEIRKGFDIACPGKRFNDNNFNAIWDGSSSKTDPIRFHAVIIEGDNKAPDLQGDNPNETLDQRINKSTLPPLTTNTYYQLTARVLSQGGALDKESTKTIIKGTTATGKVALGKQTTLMSTEMKNTNLVTPDARFRSLIRKEVQ